MHKMMERVWRRRTGFTLIELLIVVAIIGILAGIAIPNFLGARTKARVSRAFADMRTIGNALEMYYIDNTNYPSAPADDDLTDGGYITSVPKDPFGGGRSDTIDGDADGFGYYTTGSGTITGWLLVSNGPDTTPDVTSYVSGSGQFGGADTQHDYGDDWYNPASGTTSSGDLGLGGP